MGRDVIFYLYPSDFTIGNHTDMSASMVTGSETENQNSGEAGAESTQAAESLPAESSAAESTREESSAVESDPAETTAAQEESLGAEETGTQGESLESGLQNSITQAAVPSLSGEVLSEDQGLNLSTGESGTGEAVAREGLSGARIVELTISLTFSGLILLAVGSGVAYWFRKTGNSFEEEDDEE